MKNNFTTTESKNNNIMSKKTNNADGREFWRNGKIVVM